MKSAAKNISVKTILNNTSVYSQFLKAVKDADESKIKRKLTKLKKEFPVLLIDKNIPSAIYIINYKDLTYNYVSSSVETIMGYSADEFYSNGLAFYMSLVHPDDLQVVTGKTMLKFLEVVHSGNVENLNHYRFSLNYRLQRSDKTYIQILQQYTVALVDENKNPLLCIGTTTDISSFKKDNGIILSVSKYDSNTGTFKEIESVIHNTKNPLSYREIQIIKSLAKQRTNTEISQLYGISEETVRAHRRNILKKTECNKLSAAIAKAHREKWI